MVLCMFTLNHVTQMCPTLVSNALHDNAFYTRDLCVCVCVCVCGDAHVSMSSPSSLSQLRSRPRQPVLETNRGLNSCPRFVSSTGCLGLDLRIELVCEVYACCAWSRRRRVVAELRKDRWVVDDGDIMIVDRDVLGGLIRGMLTPWVTSAAPLERCSLLVGFGALLLLACTSGPTSTVLGGVSRSWAQWLLCAHDSVNN